LDYVLKIKIMGATWFQESGNGLSLRETYRSLKELAEDEYGRDSYNGTISTTHYCEDLTANFKKSKKSLQEYIEMQMDKIQKWHCGAICIQEPKDNTNKTKSQVEHIVTPGTKQWVLKYEVEEYYGEGNRVIASCTTKGDAVKAARAYTEKTQTTTAIIMRKVLTGSKPTVAKITYKKSNTERPGRWVFFGWAAE
jgi:hypothetical protein